MQAETEIVEGLGKVRLKREGVTQGGLGLGKAVGRLEHAAEIAEAGEVVWRGGHRPPGICNGLFLVARLVMDQAKDIVGRVVFRVLGENLVTDGGGFLVAALLQVGERKFK